MNILKKIKQILPQRISRQDKDKLALFQKLINYKFKKLSLLKSALTHDSIYYNEDGEININSNYERLEFLGDAVLGLIVCQHIYKVFPEKNEGDLSKLKSSIVSEKFLSLKAANFRLSEFIFMSEKEERNGGRNKKSIIADTTESVICAIYLDGGIKKATKFVKRFILSDFERQVLHRDMINYKSILQEYAQERFKTIPDYKMNSAAGPEHRKLFKITVFVNAQQVGSGEALNKKEAQQKAAYDACKRLELI